MDIIEGEAEDETQGSFSSAAEYTDCREASGVGSGMLGGSKLVTRLVPFLDGVSAGEWLGMRSYMCEILEPVSSVAAMTRGCPTFIEA